MHVSALNIGRAFFEQYLSADPEVSVLDVGGMDVNGSLRSVAGAGWRFLSVDLVEGPGVDVVLDDPYNSHSPTIRSMQSSAPHALSTTAFFG